MAVVGAQRRRPGALLDLRHRGAARGRAGRRRSRGGGPAFPRYEPRGGRRATARQRAHRAPGTRRSRPRRPARGLRRGDPPLARRVRGAPAGHRAPRGGDARRPAMADAAAPARPRPAGGAAQRPDALQRGRGGLLPRRPRARAHGRPRRRDPAAHRGLGRGRAARRTVAARLPRQRGLRRRAGRRQPGDRRLPGLGGPRSSGAAGAALPAADLDPRPHVRGALRRRDRRRRVRRPARRPRPPQSVRRRPGQPPALVPLPPTVRRTAALTAGRRGARDGGRRCTVARPRGSPATARSPRRSATRSPPATSAPRPSSSRAIG